MMEFEFPSTKEQNPGQPLVPLPVNDITNVTAGDHVLYHIGHDEYRKDYRSALVSEVNSKLNNMKIMTFTRKGVEEKWVGFASLGRLHRVEYSTCRFTAEEALSRARWLQGMDEKKLYNPIDNNGHFFVTNAKTGREHNLSDMIMDLKAQDTGKYYVCYNIYILLGISYLVRYILLTYGMTFLSLHPRCKLITLCT